MSPGQNSPSLQIMRSKGHVVVLGAGVIGLTNALVLQEAGYHVLIIAAHLPGDSDIRYTSPWLSARPVAKGSALWCGILTISRAGAQWRTHATPAEPMLCDWDVQTYDHWVALLAEEAAHPELPRAGIKMYESSIFWDGQISEDLWWATHVRGFRHLSPLQEPIILINGRSSSHTPSIQAGVTFQAMTLDAPHYLHYLYRKLVDRGVRVVRAELPDEGGFDKALRAAQDVANRNRMPVVDCFVNSTGIGARILCGDARVESYRGQTVLVKGEATAARTRLGEGYTAYCIPRPGSGTTILGGTKEKGNWSAEPDAQTTSLILERCRCIAPELLSVHGSFEVVSVQCGLRPGRAGGPRMEKESVAGKRVVHAYGHAGAGYQNSFGSARFTLQRVDEVMSDAVAKL